MGPRPSASFAISPAPRASAPDWSSEIADREHDDRRDDGHQARDLLADRPWSPTLRQPDRDDESGRQQQDERGHREGRGHDQQHDRHRRQRPEVPVPAQGGHHERDDQGHPDREEEGPVERRRVDERRVPRLDDDRRGEDGRIPGDAPPGSRSGDRLGWGAGHRCCDAIRAAVSLTVGRRAQRGGPICRRGHGEVLHATPQPGDDRHEQERHRVEGVQECRLDVPHGGDVVEPLVEHEQRDEAPGCECDPPRAAAEPDLGRTARAPASPGSTSRATSREPTGEEGRDPHSRVPDDDRGREARKQQQRSHDRPCPCGRPKAQDRERQEADGSAHHSTGGRYRNGRNHRMAGGGYRLGIIVAQPATERPSKNRSPIPTSSGSSDSPNALYPQKSQ